MFRAAAVYLLVVMVMVAADDGRWDRIIVDPDDLYEYHNDTIPSICDGHKVLHGGQGSLQVMNKPSENYSNNMNCSWEVTLPRGSRPVFNWHYFDIEDCTSCDCDYMYVQDTHHNQHLQYCGANPPSANFLTVKHNKFIVGFHSDGSVTGKGFLLQYRAVERFFSSS